MGHRESIMDMGLALPIAALGSISGNPMVPWALPGVFPEYTAKSKP